MLPWADLPAWAKALGTPVFGVAIGGLGVELLRRWKSRSDVREAEARADKTEAEGGATALSAVGAAFGEMAKHMRQELSDLRERCARVEEQLRAAETMASRLEEENLHLRAENDRQAGRIEQLAGENRQLKQVIESGRRTAV